MSFLFTTHTPTLEEQKLKDLQKRLQIRQIVVNDLIDDYEDTIGKTEKLLKVSDSLRHRDKMNIFLKKISI